MAANRVGAGDIAAIAICTLCWSTTWYAIKLQLGVVDPIVSIVYRFGSASILLFAWCILRGETLCLSRKQHAAAFGVGVFTFVFDYALVYLAEERVTSAFVAVMFAALAFANLMFFRIVFAERSPPNAWIAALVGIVGVALLSWDELASAPATVRAGVGVALTIGAVLATAAGNVFARKGEIAGAGAAASTAWAMLYGSSMLAVFAFATGRQWMFDPSWSYALSLAHLSVNGSAVAFLLYYHVARRRGYTAASYITALTPPLAMMISVAFEGRQWGMLAVAGTALILFGQWLLLRRRKPVSPPTSAEAAI